MQFNQLRLPDIQQAYSFSCLYAPVPKRLHSEVLEFQKCIPAKSLVGQGLDLDPHVTVKYGIHTDSPGVVRAMLESVPPIDFRLGNVSVFEGVNQQ